MTAILSIFHLLITYSYGKMFSQPGHMRKGLGPAPDDMTDFGDSPGRASPSLELEG